MRLSFWEESWTAGNLPRSDAVDAQDKRTTDLGATHDSLFATDRVASPPGAAFCLLENSGR